MGVARVGRGKPEVWDWWPGTLPGLGLGSLYEGLGRDWLICVGLEGDWLTQDQTRLGLARAGLG